MYKISLQIFENHDRGHKFCTKMSFFGQKSQNYPLKCHFYNKALNIPHAYPTPQKKIIHGYKPKLLKYIFGFPVFHKWTFLRRPTTKQSEF
jgi:hypothetical protein